jgi:hypothetical protein
MSLAQITKETRIILKVGGAAALVVFILFLIFQGGTFIQRVFFPAPPAPPEEKFGKLPILEFPVQNSSIPKFRINTISGVLPSFPTQIKVYQLVEAKPNITALQSARQKAASLGYTQNEQQITPTEYRWTNASQNSFLLYNIISLNFSVDSDFLTRGNFVSGGISNNSNLTKTITEFINALGSDSSDIDPSKYSYSYYISSNGKLEEVASQSNATFVRVFLNQNQVDNLEIYYPTSNPSLLHFTVGNDGSLTVVEANYTHYTPELSNSSTYPIKSSDQAYENLKNGKGYSVNLTTDSIIDITEVSLGYYLDNKPDRKYITPIYIFSGKNDFLAYVNALID